MPPAHPDDALLAAAYLEKDPGYYANARPEMLERVPRDCRRLLDVGCARGVFGASVRAAIGAEVWGVEPHPASAAEAGRVLDRVVPGAFVPGMDLPPAAFDCITLLDVLEHMPDPYAALGFARTLLRPGGAVVASVPNVRCFSVVLDLLRNGNWRYEDGGILDRTHLRFFTRSSIEEAFAGAGLAIDRIEGIRPAHIPLRYRVAFRIGCHGHLDLRYPQFAVVARLASG